ncbi:MAG: hypothetical protein OXU78_04960, partial [Deltaproteobacteria bacterium]|nr:hypothetical protein [Deltaproteobacteria bacterium]
MRGVWRAVLGVLVVMGMVGAAPLAGWAQTYHDTGPLAVDEGTLGMDGTLTASTVTLGLRVAAPPSTGTVTYTWEQIAASSFGSSSAGTSYSQRVTSTDPSPCAGGVLSSGDPGFVTLSGTTGMVTFTDASMRESLGSPTFTAPEVAETTSLYFRVGYQGTFQGVMFNNCRTYRVDIRDVTPPVVDLGADQTVDEGDAVTIAATASGDAGGAGSVPISFLFLTSTTGPTPRFTWVFQPRYDCETEVNDDGQLECVGESRLVQAAHSTTFTAPYAEADYTMVFTVTVQDSGGRTAMDTITINVEDAGAAPVGPAPPPTPAPDQPPVARAGPDQTVDEATTPQVMLDGRGSSDPEGERLAYCWTQTSGTAVGPFVGTVADTRDSCGPAGSYQSINIPVVSFSTDLVASSTLVFQLVVTVPETRDEDGNVLRAAQVSAADTVTVTVTADDDMPIVEAGDSSQRVAPGLRVALLGAYTRDDGGPPTIEWSQTAGTTVTLSSTTALQPTFTAPAVTQDTTLTFQLQATETGGAMRSVTDTVDVVVSTTTPAPVPPSLPIFEVNAGADQTVAGGAMVALDGSGSRGDTSGLGLATATDWTWTQESGPTVTLAMPCVSGCDAGRTFGTGEGPLVNHLQPTFTAPAATATPQRLEFKLSRTQGLFTRSDTVHVTVTGTDSTAAVPTVSGVSPSNAARSVNTSVTITATTAASSPTWQWWQISGTPVTLSGDTTASITFTTPATAQSGPDQFLRFAVAVTSGGVTSAPRGALITVNANNGGPEGPSSNRFTFAGADRTVAEGASTTLGADLRDPQSDTFTVQWTQYGGPPVALSDPTAEQPTFTAPTNLVATTFFYYWVVATDEHGAANSDQVRIQVDGANGLPTVDIGIPGGELRADEGTIVTLTPTISDDEGIATIQWAVETATFLYTPDIFLTSLNTGRLRFVMPYTYTDVGGRFRITVTDLHGATATDTVTIFLNSGGNGEPSAVTCLLPKIRYTLPADPSTTVDRVVPGTSCSSGQEVESGASVTLEGRDSSDPEGETLTYAWEQLTRTVLETATTPT